VTHRHISNSNRAIHRLATGSFGVIKFTIKATLNTSKEMVNPKNRTAGNMSSFDLFCCSVAKRSHSISLSRLTRFVTESISCSYKGNIIELSLSFIPITLNITGSKVVAKDWCSTVGNHVSKLLSPMVLSYFFIIL